MIARFQVSLPEHNFGQLIHWAALNLCGQHSRVKNNFESGQKLIRLAFYRTLCNPDFFNGLSSRKK
jgi:hypothetical protein